MWLQVSSIDLPEALKLDDLSRCYTIGHIKKRISQVSGINIDKQQLIFAGKTLKDDFTLYDYGININDNIQLIKRKDTEASLLGGDEPDKKKPKLNTEMFVKNYKETKSYKVGDIVDAREPILSAWFEAEILKITKKPEIKEDGSLEDSCFLFYIKYLDEPESDPIPVDSKNLRFRSYRILSLDELVDYKDKVLINYNKDNSKLRGHWHDATIVSVDIPNKTVKVDIHWTDDHDSDEKNVNIFFVNEIYQIESNVRHKNLNFEPKNLRQNKANCDSCLDKEGVICKDCNCCICGSPEDPDSQILCDECNRIFHLKCLSDPLSKIPEGDWYCPDCKNDNDENKVVKKKKRSNTTRDWGKGMACVSRQSVCMIVPSNHFGKVPGIPVGTTWLYRMQVSEAGIHRPHVAGISGKKNEGAYSLVLSGGYEDDVDNGNEFIYTGSGGRDLSGNKRVNVQTFDQKLTAQNGALAKNCSLNENVSENEAFESSNWKAGLPIRVVRNYKLAKHSEYAPKEGNRYDGIYKIVKYWPEKGKSGFIVWRYLLRRDDSEPAPWTDEGKERSKKLGLELIYPPGYVKKESPTKEKKGGKQTPKKQDKQTKAKEVKNGKTKYQIDENTLKLIQKDLMNVLKWKEIIATEYNSYSEFISEVTENFTCIICYNVVANPVTLPGCLHNICKNCIDYSIKMNSLKCPVCRNEFKKDDDTLQVNQNLCAALKKIFYSE